MSSSAMILRPLLLRQGKTDINQYSLIITPLTSLPQAASPSPGRPLLSSPPNGAAHS
jgi:hypothetical protein